MKEALRAGRFHTRGSDPGRRGPLPPSCRNAPGKTGAAVGRRGPLTASSSTRRAASSPKSNNFGASRGRRIGGETTSATQTGVIFSFIATMAVHSGVVNRSGSK
ncbi:hypothetical protein GCM10010448_23620 [Streptomyces glomeratus]|uniref:Uncharacterized protein n=1 Tax=Streptomyces glomeratus TaxID=284452 RepID=A0ABP6LFH9_9ACTN